MGMAVLTEKARRFAHEAGATYECNPGNRSLVDDLSDMAEYAGYAKWGDVPKPVRAELMAEWQRGRRAERKA